METLAWSSLSRNGGVRLSEFDVCNRIVENISRVIVGKAAAIELLMVALLGDGHVLIEDVPGLGKTKLAKALARSFNGVFRRAQCTPDLLPGDITGFSVYNRNTGDFEIRSGPIMAHIFLVDEINRAIPRTQSSLLEGMEERQVTIEGRTLPLFKPFFVIATQNPIELEGTFPLPEAQLDRFMLRIGLGYPAKGEEMEILRRFQKGDPLEGLGPVASPEDLLNVQERVRAVHVAGAVREYITDLIAATRNCDSLRYGASPRAGLALMRGSQALAAMRGRDYVVPEDVKYLAGVVLPHRLILSEEERLKGTSPEAILDDLVSRVPPPALVGAGL
ncbi:MAG: AAA family ATPase [Desulfobacteraceae bacterium]